ncbi:MAG: redoxin domain-containing protein [Planctomycetota bacterium]
MSNLSIFAGLAAVCGLAVGFAATTLSAGDNKAKAKVGEAAPTFTLMNQEGEPVSLSDFEGKIVVLEQFNDQCPFVVKHYREGHMNALASQYAEQDVVWLAIDSSNFSNVEQNAEIAAEWNIERPILDDSAGDVGKMYGAKTTPHMFIINGEGTLVYAGAIDSVSSTDTADIEGATNYVAQALDELLAGDSVSTPETKPYGCSVKY